MRLSKQTYSRVEKWTQASSIWFFFAANLIGIYLIYLKKIPGFLFPVITAISFIPYIIYLKFVRGTLQQAVQSGNISDKEKVD